MAGGNASHVVCADAEKRRTHWRAEMACRGARWLHALTGELGVLSRHVAMVVGCGAVPVWQRHVANDDGRNAVSAHRASKWNATSREGAEFERVFLENF